MADPKVLKKGEGKGGGGGGGGGAAQTERRCNVSNKGVGKVVRSRWTLLTFTTRCQPYSRDAYFWVSRKFFSRWDY